MINVSSEESGRRYERFVCLPLAEFSSRNLVQDVSESRAFLLDRDRVVSVLVSKVFHRGSQVAEEDCTKRLNHWPARGREGKVK